MLATLVIPTYRRPDRLGALLECVARQTGDSLARVVVCDDGSGDETEAVARSFADRLPLDYASQPDEGFRAGQARNLGIERAIGDVVVFLDDDVLIRPDFIEAHLNAHRGHPDAHRVVIGFRHRTDHYAGLTPTWEEIVAAERDDRVEVRGPGRPLGEGRLLLVPRTRRRRRRRDHVPDRTDQ